MELISPKGVPNRFLIQILCTRPACTFWCFFGNLERGTLLVIAIARGTHAVRMLFVIPLAPEAHGSI